MENQLIVSGHDERVDIWAESGQNIDHLSVNATTANLSSQEDCNCELDDANKSNVGEADLELEAELANAILTDLEKEALSEKCKLQNRSSVTVLMEENAVTQDIEPVHPTPPTEGVAGRTEWEGCPPVHPNTRGEVAGQTGREGTSPPSQKSSSAVSEPSESSATENAEDKLSGDNYTDPDAGNAQEKNRLDDVKQDQLFEDNYINSEELRINIKTRRSNSMRSIFRQEHNIRRYSLGHVSCLINTPSKRKLSPEGETVTGVPAKLTPMMFASPKLRQQMVSESDLTTSNWSREQQETRPRANTSATPQHDSSKKNGSKKKYVNSRRRKDSLGGGDPRQKLLSAFWKEKAEQDSLPKKK